MNMCSNGMHESVSQFVANLRKAAEKCDFRKLKEVDDPNEEMIKMGLISGLNDASVKQKVLENIQVNNDLSTLHY